MNPSPLPLDVLDDDYFLVQDGGYGDHLDHLDHNPGDRLHQPGLDLDLGLDLGLDFDSSPPTSSSSLSFPFPLGHSPSISLPDSDSASDLQVTGAGAGADPGISSASASASDFDLASGPDLSSGLDLDYSGQDTTDPAGAGSTGTGSSPSSPNPDPLVDRPRHHHLQSNNDFNNNDDIGIGIGLDWHHLPPRPPARPATPARASASLTPEIHHHHHRIRYLHNRHHRHRSRLHIHNNPHRTGIRLPDHHHRPGNRPSTPPPVANQRQPPQRFDPQPVSQRYLASRHLASQDNHNSVPLAEPSLRHGQSQRSSRPSHPPPQHEQVTPVAFQNTQDQHQRQRHNQPQADPLLQQHLGLRRAPRAARSAREAGPRRPARANWGPLSPAGRTAAEEEQDIGPGQEHLHESDSLSMDQDDELIEVVFEGPAPGAAAPQRRQQRQARQLRQQQQRRHHHVVNDYHQNDDNQGQDLMEGDVDDNGDHQAADQHVPVIDLTEEPDSPDLQRHHPINILRHNSHNLSHNHRNNHIHIFVDDEEEEEGEGGGFAVHLLPQRHPRRHMAAQNGRMPSLNRSDGSILNGNAAAVIDLTLDSPDDSIPANRRLPPPPAAAAAAAQINNQPANHPAHRNHPRRLPAPASPSPAAGVAPANRAQYQEFGRHLIGSIRGLLPNLLAVNNNNNPREAEVQIVGALPIPPHPFGNMDPNAPNALNPLAGNPPEFNYQANGFGFPGGRQPTPKPDFQPPPPARPGFTRNTYPEGGDKDDEDEEEKVVVCPSCGCELKYDPEEEDDNPRPAKKARGKKSQEEHHFWAVKNCGHVFCRNCYENRRKHSKGKDSAAAKTGFRFQPSETSKSIKIYCCATDDCDSEVSPNSAWVGIFL